MRVAALLLRIALGGIFLYAAWIKLEDPWQLFALSIDSYKLLPAWAVQAVARTLPWAEAAIGLLLIVGRWRLLASSLSSALLAVFFALMVRAYLKHMEISCGCFGPGEVISWRTLLRDGSMLAASLFLTAVSLLRPRRDA